MRYPIDVKPDGKFFLVTFPDIPEAITQGKSLKEAKKVAAAAREEIFGPVMSIIRFRDLDEVVERANNTPYGLAAAVWTRDISKAHAIANNVRAGTVWINCFDVFDAAAPFGGFKQSGMGRELGEDRLWKNTGG